MVKELLSNSVLWVPIGCWALAQILKMVLHLFTKRRLDLRLLFSAGGMPSAHATFVCALSTATAMREGIGSTLFALSVGLAIIVMYDAAGVRRAASRQARVLNRILDELFQGQPLREERLRELLGHTPVEVMVGALIGTVLTWLCLR